MTERLFLTYYAQSGSIEVFEDELLSYLNIWPDREKQFMIERNGALPVGTDKSRDNPERDYEYYSPPYSEPCILVSEDNGDTWRLAVTADFISSGK